MTATEDTAEVNGVERETNLVEVETVAVQVEENETVAVQVEENEIVAVVIEEGLVDSSNIIYDEQVDYIII